MEDYKCEVGRRLRAVRQIQGLTLSDVEERSGGEWKAVVVGSYERGDRGISVLRLSSLAAFYGVPVAHLLPTEASEHDRPRPATLDLEQLARHGDRFATLVRFVERIQHERDDRNGRVVTLRAEDVRAVAAAVGVPTEGFVAELDRARIIVEPEQLGTGFTASPPRATAL